MGTTLSSLKPPRGATHKRKRIGRGAGSGHGETATRGDKGQGARSGIELGKGEFEGGQMPLQRRIPKRGFKNHFRVEYTPVNVSCIDERFKAGEVVEPAQLIERGLASRQTKLVKILGNGEIKQKLTVKAHAFSQSAIEKIKAAGGTTELLPMKKGGVKSGEEKKQS